MQNRQDQQSDDLEQNEEGRGSSGLENQNTDSSAEDADDTQNDLAGNASGNTPDEPADDIPSGIAGTDISGEDSPELQNDSLPTDGPVSQEEGDNGDDLTNIETDDDDDLEIRE